MAKPLKISGARCWVARLPADARGFKAAWSVMAASGHAYDVCLTAEDIWDCTCPAFVYGRGKLCKHCTALKERFTANQED